MINLKFYRCYNLLLLCLIFSGAGSIANASENDNGSLNFVSDSSVTTYGPKIDLLENSSATGNVENKSDEKKRKTALGQWASKHRAEIAFSGLAIGTGVTALILNSKVKDLVAEEESLYKNFIEAPTGSDFDVLWEDYSDAHEKTEQMARVRNGFSLATGGITVAVIMSFYIGRP